MSESSEDRVKPPSVVIHLNRPIAYDKLLTFVIAAASSSVPIDNSLLEAGRYIRNPEFYPEDD